MSKNIVIYEYGLRQPTEGEEVVGEQIYLAHQYYNKLTEIERARRVSISESQSSIDEISGATDRYKDAANRVHELRKQKKLSKGHDSHLIAPTKDEIAQAVAEKDKAAEELQEIKKRYKDELKEVYKEAEDAYVVEKKKARSECGVYWGSYLHIEDAAEAARKSKTESKQKKPKPWTERPAFRPWSGHGTVAVQIQGGMPAEGLFAQDSKVRIDPVHKHAFDEDFPRGHRKKLQYTTLHLRVGSEGRSPIWAKWPLFLHRPFPKGAVVKWVKVFRVPWNQKWKYRWKVQFTLEVPAAPKKTGNKLVAVNLGWRLMDEDKRELRVATWADSDGNTGELRLDWSFRGRIEKANDLRSLRDRLKNDMKDRLVQAGIPCEKWESPGRFHRLLSDETLDAKAREIVEDWAYRDNHLWWYERGCRNGAINYRRDVYRVFAKKLATKYDIIVSETYNLKDLAEKEDRAKEPSRQRVEGAPSNARQIIESTGRREGCTVVSGESKLATQECHVCGNLEPWNAAPQVMHTCPKCEETWDQDVNNSRNMLSRALEAMKSGDLLEVSKKKTKKRSYRARTKKKHKVTA